MLFREMKQNIQRICVIYIPAAKRAVVIIKQNTPRPPGLPCKFEKRWKEGLSKPVFGLQVWVKYPKSNLHFNYGSLNAKKCLKVLKFSYEYLEKNDPPLNSLITTIFSRGSPSLFSPTLLSSLFFCHQTSS